MNQAALSLIKKYKKGTTIQSQRAELLSRNTAFIKELEKLREQFIPEEFFEKKKPFQKIYTRVSTIPITKISKKGIRNNWFEPELTSDENIKKGILNYFNIMCTLWGDFCKSWNIMPAWDGELKSLKNYQESPVALYLIEGNGGSAPILLLSINNWTNLKDVRDAWGQVEECRNQSWEKREKKGNFSRDLLWHDLVVKHGCKPREIAQAWAKKFPNDVDVLVVRGMKKDGEIDKKDLKGKFLDDQQLVEEIKRGFLTDKYKSGFEERKAFYVTGISRGKRFNPPLADAVKKATKRMKNQIENTKNVSLKTSIEIEQILKFGRDMLDHSK